MPSHIRPPNPTKGKLQEAMLAAAERAKMEDPTMETKFPQPNDLGWPSTKRAYVLLSAKIWNDEQSRRRLADTRMGSCLENERQKEMENEKKRRSEFDHRQVIFRDIYKKLAEELEKMDRNESARQTKVANDMKGKKRKERDIAMQENENIHKQYENKRMALIRGCREEMVHRERGSQEDRMAEAPDAAANSQSNTTPAGLSTTVGVE